MYGKDGLGEGVGVIDAEDEEKYEIGDATGDEMHAGLASKDGSKLKGGSKLKVGTKLKMFVSYVRKLLTRGTSQKKAGRTSNSPPASIEQYRGNVSSNDIIGSMDQRFTYREIKSITRSFKTIIGRGKSGVVFHGSIGDNQVVVKMLYEESAQSERYTKFQAEVRLLMRVHHKNITSLVGYCDEGRERGIIYEYMANGNLGMHLFDGSPNVLSWKQRLEIGYDAAKGLEYLHHVCKPGIVHRDVRCSNILLNEKFQAKLADFGLSYTTEHATHIYTVVVGTPGYLDPEYFATCNFTMKSDIYSFGVVLLELVTGRPAISGDMYIVSWVKSIVAEGNVEKIIDPRLQGDFDINTAWKVVELAMACAQIESVKRPTINDVVMDLKICLRNLHK